LSPAEWTALNQYEVDFAVRRLNWSGYPNPDTGFNWPTAAYDSTGNAAVGTWSAAARASFPYLVTTNAFAVSNVWTYLATPLDTNTTVWLSDAQGHALIAVQKLGGREVLSLTFDNAPWLIHSTVLAHGLVTWANKGLFLGERHTYLSAQIDDVFLADEMWPGGEFRQSATDWQATINWQAKFNTRTLGKNFRYDMAFNGLTSVMPFIKSGRLRVLGVTSIGRTAALPEVPTLDEQGLKGFQAVAWNGITAPARTPRDVIAKIADSTVRIVKSPELAEQLKRDPDKVAAELEKRLRKDLASSGDFNRIHTMPHSGADVPDDLDARLVVLAEAEPTALYPQGDGAFEFERTASRLEEMRSQDYLESEHLG